MLKRSETPKNSSLAVLITLLLTFLPANYIYAGLLSYDSTGAGQTDVSHGNKGEHIPQDQMIVPFRKDFDWTRVDELFSDWDKPGSPGAAVGVIHKGEMIYSRGYGEANLDYGIPVIPETVFSIASISKQFTAACIAILIEKGMLDPEDDIRDYIPEMPEYDDIVRVRHLPYHISGVRDLYQTLNFADYGLANVMTLDDKLKVIASQSALNFPPGERHLYSNAGYTLMVFLVERVSGKPFSEFANEYIFEPLGMDNTHFHDNSSKVVKNRATSYFERNEEFHIAYWGNYQGVGPAGLNTTIVDLFKWDQNLYENKLGHSLDLNRILHERGVLNNGDTINYAFGLRMGDHRGLNTVGHGGSLMGFRTNYLRIPSQEFSVIVFSNLGSFNPGSMSAKIADLYLEDLFEQKLAKYQGTFVNPDLGTKVVIKLEDGSLILERPLSPKGEMTHTGAGKFSMGSWDIEFYHDEHGDIAGFKVDRTRALNVVYEKE